MVSSSGSLGGGSRMLTRSGESHRRLDHRLGLVAMRRVPAALDFEELGAGHALSDAPDLLHRSVLVVDPLDGEHGAADRFELALDRPRAKRRMQPDVVPPPERRIGIVVMAAELLAQVGGKICSSRALDARD